MPIFGRIAMPSSFPSFLFPLCTTPLFTALLPVLPLQYSFLPSPSHCLLVFWSFTRHALSPSFTLHDHLAHTHTLKTRCLTQYPLTYYPSFIPLARVSAETLQLRLLPALVVLPYLIGSFFFQSFYQSSVEAPPSPLSLTHPLALL